MNHTRDDMVGALRAAGCRITRQRVAIVEHLAGRSDHPSARQIHRDLRDRNSLVSVATVYNTLASLVDLGLVREVEFESDDNRYDTNLAPHINLVCTVCGGITDFEGEPPVSSRAILDRVGFDTVEVKMEYRGICSACSGPRPKQRGGRS